MKLLAVSAAVSLLACGAAQAAFVVSPGGGANGLDGLYATALFENTTGGPASLFTGTPDDSYLGIGGQIVTFDFDNYRLVDGGGNDFNVYEVDSGVVEFASISVSVSADGVTFIDVTASGGTRRNLAGDEAHGDQSFARSYDLGAATLAGVTSIRYVRIDGVGTGGAGGSVGFDLDAIGGVNFQATAAVPEPAAWALMIGGFGLVGGAVRRRAMVAAA